MMNRDARHGLVTGLQEEDRAAAERLLELCNRHEGLDLPIAVDPAHSAGADTTQFLAYDRGTLVGCAWLPPDPEPEVCLMVHPAHRRQGLGGILLAAVRGEVRRRGQPGFLLVCDEASPSGTAFAAAVGGHRREAEYRLELDRAAVDRSRPRHGALQLRPADAGDLTTLVRLLAGAFGEPEAEVRPEMTRMLQQSNRRHYLATLGDEPIGMLRVGAYAAYADITGFGVLPAHRGRGYGRQMLLDTVDRLLAEGRERIVIEVATDNRRALGLYESCGFTVASAYGFYEVTA
jgi:ribosomal protein S18 acetylase RimI-like enzyme